MPSITAVNVFPIAAPPTGFGGDARNIAQGGPTYANVILEIATDQPGLKGTSIIFTNGHGLIETCDMTRSVARRFLLDKHRPVNLDQLHLHGNLGKFSKKMLVDSDYSWLGGVGVSRMAIGAVINALWDLSAKMQKLPGWHFIAAMSPRELIAFIDFEQLGDVVSPADALEILTEAQSGKSERIEKIYTQGLLAYNTAGWSGISVEELVEKTISMIRSGWPQIKIKVGASYSAARTNAEQQGKILTRDEIDELALNAAEDDAQRMIRVYQTIETEDTRTTKMKVAVDSNQIFDPRSAFIFIKHLAEKIYVVNPAFVIEWFEEPTNQHSALGHVYIQQQLNHAFKHYQPALRVPISTGEQGALPVVFKDLLHAPALGGNGKYAIDVIQMDYSRVAGLGDNLTILLLAKKARMEGRDVRICPHTGGIGLCEGMRNIQAIKQALFGSTNNAGVEDILEFVAEEDRSVHEGVFVNPAVVVEGYYQMTREPGVGVDYTEEGLANYQLPNGKASQANEKFREMAERFMLSNSVYL